MLLTTDNSIRDIRDRVIILAAYETLCRRSKLVLLKVKNIKFLIKNGVESFSILLRKSKTNQDSTGKGPRLSQTAHLVLVSWMNYLSEKQEYLIAGIDRGGQISDSSLSSGQVHRIYKRIARDFGLDESVIQGISGHSMRVGATQNLLKSGTSMQIIMQRGRWSKTDTVMRYLEHSCYMV